MFQRGAGRCYCMPVVHLVPRPLSNGWCSMILSQPSSITIPTFSLARNTRSGKMKVSAMLRAWASDGLMATMTINNGSRMSVDLRVSLKEGSDANSALRFV